MTADHALDLITAAGIVANFVEAEDECCDDAFNLGENIEVQISATRNGLMFSASVYVGEDDDFAMISGRMTFDPVEAAREALSIAHAERVA